MSLLLDRTDVDLFRCLFRLVRIFRATNPVEKIYIKDYDDKQGLWNARIQRAKLYLYDDLEYVGPTLIHERPREGLRVFYVAKSHCIVINKAPVEDEDVKSDFSLASKLFHLNFDGLGFKFKNISPPLLFNTSYYFTKSKFVPIPKEQIPSSWLELHQQLEAVGRIPNFETYLMNPSLKDNYGLTDSFFVKLDFVDLLRYLLETRTDFKPNPKLLRYLIPQMEVSGPQVSYSGPIPYADDLSMTRGILQITQCKLHLGFGLTMKPDESGLLKYDSEQNIVTVHLEKLPKVELPFDLYRLFNFILWHSYEHVFMNYRPCDCCDP
jgi:hypothetical protein